MGYRTRCAGSTDVNRCAFFSPPRIDSDSPLFPVLDKVSFSVPLFARRLISDFFFLSSNEADDTTPCNVPTIPLPFYVDNSGDFLNLEQDRGSSDMRELSFIPVRKMHNPHPIRKSFFLSPYPLLMILTHLGSNINTHLSNPSKRPCQAPFFGPRTQL